MARFYCVDAAPTLFGEVSVLRTWGQIGTHGRMSVETCATPGEAETVAARTLRQKATYGQSRSAREHRTPMHAGVVAAKVCGIQSTELADRYTKCICAQGKEATRLRALGKLGWRQVD
jgi:predicted DNA-binding WGR domain protein